MPANGWDVAPFSEAVTVANGQVDPRIEPYANMPHIGPENIVSGTGGIENIGIARDLNLISGKYLFDKNSIVYSKIRPNLNKVCIPDFDGICSADMYPLWVQDGFIKNFVFQFMLSPLFTRQAVAVSNRTGMPKINREDLGALKISKPPLKDQFRIAEILSTWDKSIEATERLLENSKKRKKGLMQQLLTGKKRLPGFTSEWQQRRLGDLFSERVERNRGDLPLLSISGEHGLQDQDESGRRDTSNEDKSKYLRIDKGDIGYNTMRMWQGRCCLADREGIVSPAYTIVSPNSLVDVRFMFYLFKQPAVVHQFFKYSQGLVSDTWNLKFDQFAKIKVLVPSASEQRAISSLLLTFIEIESKINRQIEALKREKKALMQQLLTGKKRVKVEEAA